MDGLICVSLGTSTQHVLSALDNLDPSLEMAEIRIDLLNDYEGNIEEIFRKANTLGLETIATVREIKADPGFSPTRSRLIERCLSAGCTYVDIEIEAPETYQKPLITSAQSKNVKIIISHHNYEQKEESSENLSALLDECFLKGADIAKIAVAVCSARGASRVLAIYDTDRKVVALGMGDHGRVTRIAAILLGAKFSFAAWDAASATAPGQLTREQMKDILAISGWCGKSSRKRLKV